MNYCAQCGNGLSRRVPEGDNRTRYVCDSCHTIYYSNPKNVVGAIATWAGKILLCRRAIEPALGKWTLPAGYLENGETLVEGALRETREEACATLINPVPYRVINIPHIHQIYFMFLAELDGPVYAPGAESTEVQLFLPGEIPWLELSFPVIDHVLKMYCQDTVEGKFPFKISDITPNREKI